MDKVIIFGIADLAELASYYLEHDTDYVVVAFTVDRAYLPNFSTFCNKPIVPFEDLPSLYPPDQYRLFAPLSGRTMNRGRADVYRRGKEMGYSFISYVSSKATVFNSSIGENCFILENNVLQPYTQIGNNTILWSGNHLGHHSTIQDHVFLASHVVVSGHCHIQPYCWVGVNASIRDGITLREGSFIGMGAGVTRDTDPWRAYLGLPAQKIDKDSLGINP